MASATDTADAAVRMRGVRAFRSGWEALNGVDWELRRGETHALVGEHRSGKSTLAGLISGEAEKSAGELVVNGVSVDVLAPGDARRAGVGSLGQEPRLLGAMTVAENIFLGSRRFRPLPGRAMIRGAERLLADLGLAVPPAVRLRNLPPGDQRMVELAKAVADDPDILILDDLSRRFTPAEMERVFDLLAKRRSPRRSAVFICSTLDEALECADRVTFMNAGLVAGTEDVEKIDRFHILNFALPSMASREKLRQANVELYKYKRYNESLVRNLPVGVVIVDPFLRVNLINAAAASILGAETRSMTGREIRQAFPPELCARFDALAGSSGAASEEFDLGDVPVNMTVFPFKDGDGAVLGSVVLLEDVSLDQKMKDYLVRVERLRSAAELAAGVAHEINTPLCVIRNYIELLKRQPFSEETPKRLGKIGVELDWIVEIVGGMLSFAKPSGTPLAELDPGGAMREARLLLGHRFRERGVTAEADIPETLPRIMGSESRLKQLFVNLLTNAADAAKSRIRIAAEPCENGQYLEATVEDDGPGIPDDVRKEMFNPFFTTKAGRLNTGLGLAICQQIMDAHNGLLLVDRRDGMTVFTLRFPVRKPC